jgi:hypothetical protein
MIPAVKLKHGSTIRTFDYDESQSLQSLQAAVSATTGVPAERMKLMVKGKLIKVGQPGLTQRLGTTAQVSLQRGVELCQLGIKEVGYATDGRHRSCFQSNCCAREMS